LKGVIRDYILICDSYYEALRGTSPAQIEAVDMGRRGLHNEGAELLKTRLDGKIAIDHETARRLFTLVTALYRRATRSSPTPPARCARIASVFWPGTRCSSR